MTRDNQSRIDRLSKPLTLTSIYSVSCGVSAEEFFTMLKSFDVKVLVDTRRGRSYQWARFAHGDDLPYLCNTHGIEYVWMGHLAPMSDLRKTLHGVLDDRSFGQRDRAEAWTEFLFGYKMQLGNLKILSEESDLRKLIYGDYEKIAFMCSCQHHRDCHRQVLVETLRLFVDGIGLKNLYPNDEEPRRKSPRRYLLREMPYLNISKDLPRSWRS